VLHFKIQITLNFDIFVFTFLALARKRCVMGFRSKLTARQVEAKSLVCVGLDPLIEKMPSGYVGTSSSQAGGVLRWMEDVVDETGPCACMFKPNSAYWEALPDGLEELEKLICYIHTSWPSVPVFLDCKRGDIARTQKQYGVAAFDILRADGMNFSPYMGKDCMAALVGKNWMDKALVGLCYTSNPEARQVQDVSVSCSGFGFGSGGSPLWELFAYWIFQWSLQLGVVDNAGLVMAAAYENPKGSGNVYSEHLTRCRQIVCDHLWFLIPGVGTQGGFVKETVRCAYTGPGTIAINSSSGIIFAENPGQAARDLRDQINSAL
jgi:orotidine-5'-phosphate decarboxylase